jgi:hypothetical protein
VRRVPGGAGLAAVLALAAAACGGGTPSGSVADTAAPSSEAVARTPTPSSLVASPRTTATSATPSPRASAPAASVGTSAGVAVEDPSLIAILPATVAGQPVVLESQAFTDAVADPAFAANVEAAAFGVVVAGNDLAVAMVARPVSGAWSEAWFRDWRDSYDEGACAQAGGVAGTAEAQLGGRTVYIGTCAGGLRTYHAWLADRGLLVSGFSVGDGRYGEQLMTGLRP